MSATALDLDQLGLSFDAKGGPLLAVCGLCGGAGASSLSYLVAWAAARSSRAPVLAMDTGGPTGALAVYAGARSPRSLAAAAEALANDEPLTGGLFATAGHGLRVIASDPEFVTRGEREAIMRVLSDARDAHGLTVVDCGVLAREVDQLAVQMATHVVWLAPATVGGLQRARRALGAIAPCLPGREIVVARGEERRNARAPLNALADLADERGAPLVLMPRVPDTCERPVEEIAEAAQITLQALGTLLSR